MLAERGDERAMCRAILGGDGWNQRHQTLADDDRFADDVAGRRRLRQNQLRLAGAPAYGEPWPNFPAYLRIQAPGCYAIQLDGDTFSEVVVFSVTFGQ